MKKYLILVLIVLLIGALSVGGLGSEDDVWITESNESAPLEGQTIDGNVYVQVDKSERNKVIIMNCTITGNIEVISGNVTDIGPGNIINGNVEIGSDAIDTWVYNSSINGNVEAKGASYVVVMGNTIDGNIELTDCLNPANPGPDDADIWGNYVEGNIEIKNSPGYNVGNNWVTGEVEIE